MTRLQLYLPDEMIADVRLQAEIEKLPMAEVFRKYFKIGIEKNRQNTIKKTKNAFFKNKGALRIENPDPELWKKIDDILYRSV